MIISANICVKPESTLNVISVCFIFLYKMLKMFLNNKIQERTQTETENNFIPCAMQIHTYTFHCIAMK